MSLTFSLLQGVCIAYLFHRNVYPDRSMALYQSAIAIQEFVQFLLWAFVFNDEDHPLLSQENTDLRTDEFLHSPGLCSWLNRALTYVLMIVVNFIPCVICVFYICGSVGV